MEEIKLNLLCNILLNGVFIDSDDLEVRCNYKSNNIVVNYRNIKPHYIDFNCDISYGINRTSNSLIRNVILSDKLIKNIPFSRDRLNELRFTKN